MTIIVKLDDHRHLSSPGATLNCQGRSVEARAANGHNDEEALAVRAQRATERITDHPEVADITLQGVLDALADPVRRSIFRQLASASEDIACGTFDISVTRSTGTHHFRVLRQAGIIRQHYVGTLKMNTLRRTELDSLFPGLLDALAEAASREAGSSAATRMDLIAAAAR
jgi:DNA-binding transcriptional ArsR family regulator